MKCNTPALAGARAKETEANNITTPELINVCSFCESKLYQKHGKGAWFCPYHGKIIGAAEDDDCDSWEEMYRANRVEVV